MSTVFADLLWEIKITTAQITQELVNNTPVQDICAKFEVPPEEVEAIRKALNTPKE